MHYVYNIVSTCLLFSFLLLPFTVGGETGDDSATNFPSLGECRQIVVHCASGDWLRIFRNGSARRGWNWDIQGDYIEARPGTFDFPKVYSAYKNCLGKEGEKQLTNNYEIEYDDTGPDHQKHPVSTNLTQNEQTITDLNAVMSGLFAKVPPWKTYKNDKYGYEIQYPLGCELIIGGEGIIKGQELSVGCEGIGEGTIERDGKVIFIKSHTVQFPNWLLVHILPGLSVDQIAGSCPPYKSWRIPTLSEIERGVVNNASWQKVKINGMTGLKGQHLGDKSGRSFYYITDQAVFVVERFPGEVEKTISSFKIKK